MSSKKVQRFLEEELENNNDYFNNMFKTVDKNIILDNEQRKQMGINGRKKVEKEYNKKKNARKKTIDMQLKERDKSIATMTKQNRKKRMEAKTCQEFIGYKRMFKNGICEVDDGVYSQTIEFNVFRNLPSVSFTHCYES